MQQEYCMYVMYRRMHSASRFFLSFHTHGFVRQKITTNAMFIYGIAKANFVKNRIFPSNDRECNYLRDYMAVLYLFSLFQTLVEYSHHRP